MYRVSVESEDTYLSVMRNVFSHRLHVHRKYDLKVRRGDYDLETYAHTFPVIVIYMHLLFVEYMLVQTPQCCLEITHNSTFYTYTMTDFNLDLDWLRNPLHFCFCFAGIALRAV